MVRISTAASRAKECSVTEAYRKSRRARMAETVAPV